MRIRVQTLRPAPYTEIISFRKNDWNIIFLPFPLLSLLAEPKTDAGNWRLCTRHPGNRLIWAVEIQIFLLSVKLFTVWHGCVSRIAEQYGVFPEKNGNAAVRYNIYKIYKYNLWLPGGGFGQIRAKDTDFADSESKKSDDG